MTRENVAALQAALNDAGFDAGAEDGLRGPRTNAALGRAADAGRLAVISRVASLPVIERKAEPWRGAGRRLDAWDFGRIARLIRVDEDTVRAVVEIEAAGAGFDAQGRLKMLFEPHVFWRELAPGPTRMRAEVAGLAYQRWGTRPYPADSYPRLLQAVQIDRPAALRSCSWGLGQVMGFNHKAAGYHSAEAMVEAFAQDEEVQVEGMIAFIVGNGLDDALRRRDWSAFAFGYNGPGYATHGYHTKLAAAYAKWARVPDVPQPEGA